MHISALVVSYLTLTSSASAFVTPVAHQLHPGTRTSNAPISPLVVAVRRSSSGKDESPLPLPLDTSTTAPPNTHSTTSPLLLLKTAATTAGLWTTLGVAALADSPDWGLFEGRTGSLMHPVGMGSMLLFSLYTGFLGLQWRRQRTLGGTIQDKQALLKTLSGDDVDATPTSEAVALEQEIKELQQERKDLAAAGPRDRHFAQGSLLAFMGTCFAMEGPLNTYARAGKLFPGPHLYVGAALVCVWAAAVATVPAMQKGNETARTLHITANVAGLSLFAWQVQSGLPILFKVIEKTSWP